MTKWEKLTFYMFIFFPFFGLTFTDRRGGNKKHCNISAFPEIFYFNKQIMLTRTTRTTQIVGHSYTTGAPKVHAVASKGFNLQTDAYGKKIITRTV